MQTTRRESSDALPALVQGSYYLVTGLWPLVHIGSFQRITGPKLDHWLVKTVGGLAAAIGVNLLVSGRRHRRSRDLALLGASTAVAFGAVETWYALRGRISKVYLADAALEAAFTASWLRRVLN